MHRISAICAIAVAALLAGCVEEPPRPEITDGIFNLDPAACGDNSSVTRLTISGDQFRFYESLCRMQPGTAGAEGLQATLICSGEGETFERNVTLKSSGNLLSMREADQRFDYHRCS
ncbi:hypothetical protein Q0601_09020 [Paracoccus onubensis]|uniref:hypothetical protein n=1 Tax=Paracoccus onubensis TaxID=1675788 RepID=UPI002730FF8A|nr:hypothetical protein [Paracoccus onubensis]MDP0927309.1 hypothetical protein [Paracoccus onubensis]